MKSKKLTEVLTSIMCTLVLLIIFAFMVYLWIVNFGVNLWDAIVYSAVIEGCGLVCLLLGSGEEISLYEEE